MTTQVAIRRLLSQDLGDYKALRDAMLAAHPEAFTSDAATERGRSAQSYGPRLGFDRPDGGHFVLGAWQGARLGGAIGCERDPRAKVAHIGHVIGMMVINELHGRGIGRELLVECVAQARRAQGLTMLTLSVTAGNDRALGLYEHCGFVRYGSLPNAIYVDGRFHAKELMALTL
jgi:ribosomal protein S18 acetylase RimI-like enzyme